MRRIGEIFLFLLLAGALLMSVFLYGSGKRQVAEEAPKKEAPAITVYTNWPQGMVSVLAPAFTEETGIYVRVVDMSGEEMKKEAAGGNPADLYLASQKVLMDLADAGKTAAYTSGATDTVLDEFKEKDGLWTGLFVNPVVFAVNLEFAEKNPDFIYSWNDVLQRKSVRISLLDFPATEFSADSLMSLVEHYGTEEAYRLLGEAAPHVVQYGEYLSTPAQMAAMDKCDIGISGYVEAAGLLAEKMPIRIFYPEEGTWYFLYGAALDKNAGKEAKVFLEWLLTNGAEEEKLLASGFGYLNVNARKLPEDAAGHRLHVWHLEKRYTEGGKNGLLEQWVREIRFGERE